MGIGPYGRFRSIPTNPNFRFIYSLKKRLRFVDFRRFFISRPRSSLTVGVSLAAGAALAAHVRAHVGNGDPGGVDPGGGVRSAVYAVDPAGIEKPVADGAAVVLGRLVVLFAGGYENRSRRTMLRQIKRRS